MMLISVRSQDAPVTVAGSVINPQVGTDITVPVTIRNYEDIGSFSLVLDYDPAVVTFINNVPNVSLDNFLLDNNPLTGRIVISQYSLGGITLGDGSHLVDLTFHYLGGTTALSWFTENQSCEYAKFDGGLYTVLNDMPHPLFYIDGAISGHSGPVTYAPVLTEVPQGSLSIPVMVTGFNDIGTISLKLEYDGNVLVYGNLFTGNPLMDGQGTWVVGTQDGAGGKKFLIISWIKNASPFTLPPTSLPDSSILITLSFSYPDSTLTSPLHWVDDGSSCEYSDGNYNILWDDPTRDFYIDGVVTGRRMGPVTYAPVMTAIPETPVSLPVVVQNFTEISSFNLTLDYNPAVLTFQSATFPNTPVTWTVSALAAIPGRLILTGSGPSATLADSIVLANADFIYHTGGTLLKWFDTDTVSCRYIDAVSLLPLHDTPQSEHYINGVISPAPNVDLKVYLQGPYNLSTGFMSTLLNSQDLLPLAQPYSGAPWNYDGAETVAGFSGTVSDWVLVELRSGTGAATTVASRAGLLHNNGVITGLDGISPLGFPGTFPGSYYVVVFHRNHIPVMSSSSMVLRPVSIVYDFTTGPDKYYGGTNGAKQVDAGLNRWGMFGGDATGDGNVYINDYTDYWVPAFGVVQGYNPGDFNLDGNVYIDDNTDYWTPNFGINNALP
jgi:hypothetical protein